MIHRRIIFLSRKSHKPVSPLIYLMPDRTINRMFRKKKGGLLIESRIKLKNAKLEEYKQKKNSIVYLCKFNVHTNSGIIQSWQTIEFPELATSRLGKTGQYFLESMFSC